MNQKIHDILQEAGAAKGINLQECFLLLALKNPRFLQNFESRLDEEVKKGKLPESEKNKTMLQLEELAEKNSQSEKKYLLGVINAFDESFIALAKEEIEKQKQFVEQMEQEVEDLLSQ